MERRMRAIFALLFVALAFGGAGVIVGGPLLGDVAATRALQTLLGSTPDWAEMLTRTAKAPLLWGALALAAALAGLAGGWRAALAAPIAYGFVWLADRGLRAVLYAPKPDPDLVAVASASAASGLPSTFGLVYGGVFGLVLWLEARGRLAMAARLAALLLVAAGCAARVVLGGHWTSQMIASLALGLLLARLALWIVRNPGLAATAALTRR